MKIRAVSFDHCVGEPNRRKWTKISELKNSLRYLHNEIISNNYRQWLFEEHRYETVGHVYCAAIHAFDDRRDRINPLRHLLRSFIDTTVHAPLFLIGL